MLPLILSLLTIQLSYPIILPVTARTSPLPLQNTTITTLGNGTGAFETGIQSLFTHLLEVGVDPYDPSYSISSITGGSHPTSVSPIAHTDTHVFSHADEISSFNILLVNSTQVISLSKHLGTFDDFRVARRYSRIGRTGQGPYWPVSKRPALELEDAMHILSVNGVEGPYEFVELKFFDVPSSTGQIWYGFLMNTQQVNKYYRVGGDTGELVLESSVSTRYSAFATEDT